MKLLKWSIDDADWYFGILFAKENGYQMLIYFWKKVYCLEILENKEEE